MKFKVITTDQADADLRDIYQYIAFDLLSPENASGQLSRLEEQILSLETFPERCRKYEKEPWRSRGLRIMPVDNYLVFYIPNQDSATVTVLRVMYGGRDADKQLTDNAGREF